MGTYARILISHFSNQLSPKDVTQGLMSGIRNNKKRAKLFGLIPTNSAFEKFPKHLRVKGGWVGVEGGYSFC